MNARTEASAMLHRPPLTVGSLFAGIGGIELGLEWTGGFKTVWQVEIDDYARKVLQKHWPDVRQWSDVRTFPATMSCVGLVCYPDDWAVDLICAGFPCQDISNAGKRAGISGARSGLFREVVRVVGLLKPRWVLLENVAALLGRGMGDVVQELATLGYGVEWHCIPAAALGAPHIRDRVFILAHSDRGRPHIERRGIAGASGKGEIHVGGNGPLQPVAHADGERFTGWPQQDGQTQEPEVKTPRRDDIGRRSDDGPDAERDGREQSPEVLCGRESVTSIHGGNDGGIAGQQGNKTVSDAQGGFTRQLWGKQLQETREGNRRLYWPDSESGIRRVADGIPSRVDRLRCLGNAVVPQVSQWLGDKILEYEH